MIRIDLDWIRKDLPGVDCWARLPRATVTSEGRKRHFQSVGNTASLQSVCAALRELGAQGQAEVYRDDILVFAHPINIESMAKGVASPNPPEGT